jgi:SAM-dependent methyltransferase
MEPGFAASQIDTTKPHPARMYDAYLGGKDNYPVDRQAVRQILRDFPEVRGIALANRAFLQRAVRFLVQAGIRQFLDIGTGIPSAGNVHEVAEEAAPGARVVYVDNDPIVLAHARALLTSSRAGAVAYIDADLREPDKILNDPQLQQTLDSSKPIALLLVAVLHFIPDPAPLLDVLRRALPSGSYIALSHGTKDLLPKNIADIADEVSARSGVPVWFRSRLDLEKLLDGLEILEPGIVPIADWRSDAPRDQRPAPADASLYGVVARIL